MQIKLLDRVIPVHYRSKPCEDDDEHSVTMGHYLPPTDEIEIFVKAPLHQRAILVHEIVEAIDQLCDLELNHTQITTIGTAINQMLRDNPQFRKLYEK